MLVNILVLLSFGTGLYLSLQAFPNRQVTTTIRTETVTGENSVSINDTKVQVRVLYLRLIAQAQPIFILKLTNTDPNLTLRSVSVMLIPGGAGEFRGLRGEPPAERDCHFLGKFRSG